MDNSNFIITKAIKNIKWSASIELATRIISPLLLIILARLLAPGDFGLVSTATIAITFFQIFWDAGLSKALVQNNELHSGAANVVFWTNLVFSIVVYVVLFFSASAIASFFNSPGSELVIKVLGIQTIISSFGSVQQNLQVREINYKPLFIAKLLTAIVPALISIPMALLGFGVWALIAGNMIGNLLGVGFLWFQSSWRPNLSINISILPRLLKYGIWVMFEGLLGWFINMGDNLWVGHFLGTGSLGKYQVGWSITTILFSIVLSPLLSVLFPAFSRLSNDAESRTQMYWKTMKIITFLCLPMGFGLFFIGSYLELVLVNESWAGIGAVISWIGLLMGFSWTIGVNAELYRAIGRPDVNTKILFICFLYYAPAYYFASQLGLNNFVIVRFLVGFLSLPIHYVLMKKILNIRLAEYIAKLKPILLSLLIMVAVLASLVLAKNWISVEIPPILSLIVLVLAGMGAYLGGMYLIDKQFLIDFRGLIKDVVRKESHA
ncbi:MAG TPA: lipopolysaccharide biosynthesis protein [Longilinea sp.]|nr:lipopolysaccharide biosynthesis protein [Longilinea sp.]